MDYSFEEHAARVLDTTVKSIRSKNRKRPNVYARYLCYMYLKNNTSLTYTAIGNRYDKDHSCVIHGLKTVHNLLDVKDTHFINKVNEFNRLINDESLVVGNGRQYRTILRKDEIKVVKFMLEKNIPAKDIASFYGVNKTALYDLEKENDNRQKEQED